MSDRDLPLSKECPECNAKDTIEKIITAPTIVSGTGSNLKKAGSGWRDLLGRIKKGSSKRNTIKT